MDIGQERLGGGGQETNERKRKGMGVVNRVDGYPRTFGPASPLDKIWAGCGCRETCHIDGVVFK